MNVIDNILLEWAYRCPDGIVDIDNPEKVKILSNILKEELDSKESLINLINSSDLNHEQIQNLIKYVTKRTQHAGVNGELQAILAKKGIKRTAPLVIQLANNFDIENKLLEYLQDDTKNPSLSSDGNLFTLFNSVSGLPIDFIKALTQTTSNQLGAGELTLVTFLKDAKKLIETKGKGDIKVGNEVLELKGKGAALSEWGSKAPIRDAFKEAYDIQDEEALADITNTDKWIKKLVADLKNENKDKAEKAIKILYPGFAIDSDNLEVSIVQNYIDQYFKDSSVTHLLILDENTGDYKKINKEELKGKIGKDIEYSFKKDIAPRISLKANIKEGAKVDFEDGVPVNITISSKPISGEQLITVEGTRVTNNYDVYYSLESNPKADNIKASQDALKYNADKISEGDLREIISKTLKNRLAKVDYIGFLESKGTLNNMLLGVIKDIYNVPSENVVSIEKMEYKFIDNVVDWEQFQKESESIQKAIMDFLEKTSQKPSPYKIRKSGEIQSSIIQRLHSKYDLGLNPNESDRPLPPIYNVILDCLNNKKTLLIVDDNIHSGTDFFKIFGSINTLIEKIKEESSKSSENEQKASIELQNITNNPKFKTSSFLQDKYKELQKIVNQYKERKLIITKQYSKATDDIFGYVLYRLKDSDLKAE